MAELTPLDLAERVATLAAGLGIDCAIIGAYALAAHHYVRATRDLDLAVHTTLADLRRLKGAVEAAGLRTQLRTPDEEDPLGGVLVVYAEADADGDPVEPVDVVNFDNPYRPRRTPAQQAIRNASRIAEKPALRYPRLADLIALKLDAGSLRDDADVVELLAYNPDADLAEIRAVATSYGFERIESLIEHAQRARPRPPRG